MILWCAYCQTFQGETPPYDDLTPTHGICLKCKPKGLDYSEAEIESIRKLAVLQKKIWEAGRAADVSKFDEIIEDCQKLKIRPVDLMVGILTPSMTLIGNLWATNRITVREEHIFTGFVEKLYYFIEEKLEKVSIRANSPRFLIVQAEGNQHSIGLRIFNLWLKGEGYQTELIVPGLPHEEIDRYLLDRPPDYLAFSISDEKQIPRPFKNWQKPICIGGLPVKLGLIEPQKYPHVSLVHSFLEFFEEQARR